ncbi:hypothetical protein G6F32_015713 [Rhizopus arrhizus]|nr:hypothetical protein G6F32_015713 [Rhizopus arrhizus]
MGIAQDALGQLLGKDRVIDDYRAFGVVVLAAWIEVVGADHPDAAVDHQRLRMQAHARALAGDRQRLVDRLAAEERRPRLGTQQPRLHFAAGGAAAFPRILVGAAGARVVHHGLLLAGR